MKKLVAVFIFIPSFCWADGEADTATQACTDAINSAKESVRYEASKYSNAITPASTLMSTGNPVTDITNQMNQLSTQAAQVEQQRVDALGQVEDNCFQQNETLSDNEQKSLVADIRRQQDITNAEADKIRQDAEIKAGCAREAATNYQSELARLQGYQARIVSNVGAATEGEAKLRQLENDFYNRCWNSPATQISLDSNREALELKMRNFATEKQAVMAEREYINVKRAHLSGYCELQVNRVDEKNRMASDTIKQQQQQLQIGLGLSVLTSQFSATEQGAARESFSSLEQMLSAAKWTEIANTCLNLHSANSALTPYRAPADVAPYFTEVNAACRPEGSQASCVISSGAYSQEAQQRAQSSGSAGSSR